MGITTTEYPDRRRRLTSGIGALLLAAYAAGVGVMSDVVGRLGVVGLLLAACGIASAAEFWLVRRGRLDARLAWVTAVLGALSAPVSGPPAP